MLVTYKSYSSYASLTFIDVYSYSSATATCCFIAYMGKTHLYFLGVNLRLYWETGILYLC